MRRIMVAGVILVGAWATLAGQEDARKNEIAPIYNVTVVEHGLDAVNYQYRSSEPAKVDFRGTVLLPNGKGQATVESRQGSTRIDSKFENLKSPERFGREYLTYVLWAISPEGASRNLGELVSDTSNHAALRTSTDLQAFGLLVTAEPYSTVRSPSGVVVMENQIRPDTPGKIEPIQAKHELMPGSHYTMQVNDAAQPDAKTQKVSMDRYVAILELYQAQNAIGIARSAKADTYAADTLARAQKALDEAQRLESSKANTKLVIQSAREAAQTADDARVIAERRAQDQQLSEARKQAAEAQKDEARAEAEAQRAKAEADAARAEAAAERAARERAERGVTVTRPATTVPASSPAPATAPQ